MAGIIYSQREGKYCKIKTCKDSTFMSLSTDKKIMALKEMALGRCRERIELAAGKAKSSSEVAYETQHGLTSILKRNRGLL
jgi:hypothetical protein